MSSIFLFINNLYCWICNSYTIHWDLNKNLEKADGSFISFWNLKALCLICSMSLSHSLSFVVNNCHLPLAIPLVFPHCHSMYHSSVLLQTIKLKTSIERMSHWNSSVEKRSSLHGRMDGFICSYKNEYVWKKGWMLLLCSNKMKHKFKAYAEEWK